MHIYDPTELPSLPARARTLQIALRQGSAPHPFDLASLRALPPLPALRTLSLTHAQLTPEMIEDLASLAPDITSLSLSEPALDGDLVPLLSPLKQLSALTLHRAPDVPLARLVEAPWARKLTSLSLREQTFSVDDARALSTLPHLETLLVEGRWDAPEGVEPHSLAPLASAPALTHLCAPRPLSQVEAEALAQSSTLGRLLAPIRDLTSVDPLTAFHDTGVELVIRFESVDAVDEALLAAIADRLPRLVGLEISQRGLTSSGRGVTGDALANVGRLRHLRTLTLSGAWKLKVSELAFLAGLTSLESLSLEDMRSMSGGVTRHLAKLPALRRLDLTAVKLNDKALQKLAGLPLEALKIDKAKISDAGLAHIGQIHTLRHLSLDGLDGPITDAGLAALGALPELDSLHVVAHEVSSAGLRALAEARALRRLSLRPAWTTPAEDEWLEAVGSLPSLEQFGMESCANTEGLTDEGLRALSQAPRLVHADIPTSAGRVVFSEPALTAWRQRGVARLTAHGYRMFHIEICPTLWAWACAPQGK